MIEQLELNWSRFGHPSFDWDSEWKSIIQDKKSSYELCHNQSKDTYSIICQDKDLIYFNLTEFNKSPMVGGMIKIK